MTEIELRKYLRANFPKENEGNEWKEFKNLKNDFNGKEKDDVISYVSALANMEGGNLVIGVVDETLEIVGTNTYNYNTDVAKLRIKDQCANMPTDGLSIDEYLTDDTGKTVWVIHIPKHLPRLLVYAHCKAFQRLGSSLIDITKSRLDAILNEKIYDSEDWSSEIIPNALISDLDPKAITKAREKYTELHPDRKDEIASWSDETFLNKAKIIREGKITNASIILLGREESEHFISPAVCKIRWSLKDGGDQNKDFRILSIPMILAVEEFEHLVRNTTYTYTIEGNMFPESMMRYDVFTLREPLCNAVAHQNYQEQARIEVVEYEDEKLMFRNYGSFLPGSVEEVVQKDFPESHYRNPFLVEAMRNVKMVETEGGGIRKLFVEQKKRFFPMPHYELGDNYVICEIEGKVLNENFARILVNNTNLTLSEIILLDKVQKLQPIADDALKLLRSKGFIEGRKPNIYLSAKIAKASKHIGLKTSYIKNRSFNDDYYRKLIIEYIKKFGSASRAEINQLLLDKLPESLQNQQRVDKVTNLLSSMRRSGKITVGQGKRWILVE